MRILLYLIIACLLWGCASDGCRTYSCRTYKRTETFCNEVRAEGEFCLEYDYFNYCTIDGLNNQKIATMCMDSLVYREILEVFDGKWVGGETVGNARPSSEPTEVGPYWIDRIEYSYSSSTQDLIQGETIYHHYCRSKDNKNCDLILRIHTGRGPIYQYNYETKEIQAIGWPI